MNTVQIEYQVSGFVSQSVQILKEGMTTDDLVLGLQNGTILPTVGSSQEFLETTNWTVVAKVLDTAIMDDMEYSAFELEETNRIEISKVWGSTDTEQK